MLLIPPVPPLLSWESIGRPTARRRTLKRLTLLVFCLVASLHAQYPPEIQWRKIRTAHFEIVFPRKIAPDAQRAANMLETLFGPLTESLATGLKRTTVLLPNQGITRYVGG